MCTHANSEKVIYLDEKAMLQRILTYTDRIFKIVKPRRVLYLAIDGVAPRAKVGVRPPSFPIASESTSTPTLAHTDESTACTAV